MRHSMQVFNSRFFETGREFIILNKDEYFKFSENVKYNKITHSMQYIIWITYRFIQIFLHICYWKLLTRELTSDFLLSR